MNHDHIERNDDRRDKITDEKIDESVANQDEAKEVMMSVAERLDALAEELRAHGAFPIAGQLETARERIRRGAGGGSTG
jgi:hypothetical protein